MRSAFFVGGKSFEIREIPRPIAMGGEVVVDVHACGICGSDLHFFLGGSPPPRACPGHEICGRVATDSPELEPGTAVVVEPIRACGACQRCRAGEPNLCPFLQILGSRLPGGFADAVVAPVASVYPLPPSLDLDTAMIAEPLAVAIHGVELGTLETGSEVLVLGAGAIGLLTAFVAARRGAAVTISARHPHQAAAAQMLGARQVIGTDPDLIKGATKTRPPDVVFETVGGDAETVDLALGCVRAGGRIVTLGLFTRPIAIHPLRFLAKEVRIVGSMMYSRRPPRPDFAVALDLLVEARQQLATLVTHRVALADIHRGFRMASDKHAGVIKVAVDVARNA
jgi:(R,R)-butanediol dehydrogenase / meso-butanediol dehydrogenase / diacetyl reductase